MKPKAMTASFLAVAAAIMTVTTATAQQAPASAPSPEQERAVLNGAEAQAAASQVDQNEANQRHYNAAMHRWENNVAAYHDAAAAHHADVAQYRRDMALWHADVAACEAGDHTRCAPPEQ